jgi:hypothetical protein
MQHLLHHIAPAQLVCHHDNSSVFARFTTWTNILLREFSAALLGVAGRALRKVNP